MLNLILILVASALVVSEWNYRAKKYGKKEATKAMIMAAIIFIAVSTAFRLFFPLAVLQQDTQPVNKITGFFMAKKFFKKVIWARHSVTFCTRLAFRSPQIAGPTGLPHQVRYLSASAGALAPAGGRNWFRHSSPSYNKLKASPQG